MAKSPVSILYDAEGNPVAVVQDDTVYRLAVTSKIQDSAGTVIDPAIQGTQLNNYELLNRVLKELQRMRVLLEHLTDEKVHEYDLETGD